ncbi:hypothetical protein CDL15_Pgr014428 [Punica granatum]|uniref:Uncharacterized protein n=1 Tax=Punica granatum TaxID=22663 RepID=A0A218WD56_PUNGR|nr:hypothetical protein CDL15_Pgr014428 [Punica granatum]
MFKRARTKAEPPFKLSVLYSRCTVNPRWVPCSLEDAPALCAGCREYFNSLVSLNACGEGSVPDGKR